MKKIALLPLALAAAATASAQSNEAPSLHTPSLRLGASERVALAASPATVEAFSPAAALQADGAKKGQVWLGFPSLSYEAFAGDNAGNEFGFSPTNYLGYQRNFYPNGRLKNGVGYSLGVGFAALGASIFYHQGAGRGVDFRAGIAADFVYYDNFSYFGGSNFIVLPYIAWGIKI